ncbi:hypothetical protein [Microbacterium sp. P02]|uniref:hypothetical protein n=1 Tax=Microbacterium sp. P02 TaxID=3366260 RepID=UPI00366F391A
MSLSWVEADASHLDELSRFCCTYNGEQYQLDIELFFQELEFPPDPPGLKVLLGFDEIGLATACAWEYVEIDTEPPMHYIWALGRDNRVHGTTHAFHTLEEVLHRCMTFNRQVGHEWGALVVVDSANYASIELLRRSGFHPAWRESTGEEAWAIPLGY